MQSKIPYIILFGSYKKHKTKPWVEITKRVSPSGMPNWIIHNAIKVV